MMTRDDAKRLLREQPYDAFFSVQNGMVDRATVEHLANDKPLPRQKDVDAMLKRVTAIALRACGPNAGSAPVRRLGLLERWRLRRHFRVAEVKAGDEFHCMCFGTEAVSFLADDEIVASITFHHGRSVRWDNSWRSDVELVNPRPLLALLGARECLRELEESEEQKRDQHARLVAFRRNAPGWIARAVNTDLDALQKVVIENTSKKERLLDLVSWASAPRLSSPPGIVSPVHLLPEVCLASWPLTDVCRLLIDTKYEVHRDVLLNFISLRTVLQMMNVPVSDDLVPDEVIEAALALASPSRDERLIRDIANLRRTSR